MSSNSCQPGCSFTFDGLKQTLLALRPGIESKLSKVSHLLVNYRTTRDILVLANAILSVAKKHFPDHIAHSLPETAMKDLGLKVRVCDFEDATALSLKFGHNQALIHSSDDASDYEGRNAVAFRRWLKDHPFILTSLESKGLEFDDVVVSFTFNRKVWDVSTQRVESLRMLRELYVAVTRAKRRVVLLVKRKDAASRGFIDSLGCDIETIKDSQLQVEFDCDTSADTWREKGVQMFDEGHFGLAASCFAAANEWGLSNWSRGKHLKSLGNRQDAASAYRRAARSFFEELDYEHTLDVLQELSYCPPWDEGDNAIFDAAQSVVPTHFSRHETVRLFLVRDCWAEIQVSDLKDLDSSTLFPAYKDHPELKTLIKKCKEEERREIGNVLPSLIAQYYFSVQNYSFAVELYLRCREIKLATESTRSAVDEIKASDADIREIYKVWSQNPDSMRKMHEESYVPLLIRMFSSPLEVAQSAGKKCLQSFGRKVVINAVNYADIGMEHLYDFHPTEFRTEVNAHLESMHSCCAGIVQWYIEKHDYENANEYIQSQWKKLSNSVLLKIISLHRKIRPGKLFFGKKYATLQHLIDISTSPIYKASHNP